jgi:hypothetical protein
MTFDKHCPCDTEQAVAFMERALDDLEGHEDIREKLQELIDETKELEHEDDET